MENFINIIRKKDEKIDEHFEKLELKHLAKINSELEEEHESIKENLKDVNYLLDLIESHNIKASKTNEKQKLARKIWLEKTKPNFESLHLALTQELSDKDIQFLQNEKSKLLFEKEQLEKKHHLIHKMIAKSHIYSVNVQNTICKNITKGYDVAAVGEKLLDHFGKKINGSVDYGYGRDKIRRMLEKTFSINKIQSRELIDILENRKVVFYDIDYSDIYQVPNYGGFDQFIDPNYTPLYGIWHINA
jgi:hypothetical protein